MRIGILGAGNMAGALGAKWVRAGHDVVIGARSAERAEVLAKRIGARAGTFAEAAGHGDAVLSAVGHGAAAEVVGPAAERLAGKALLDCSNPIVPGPGGLMLTTGGGPSAARALADAAPGAHVVKAFHLCAAEVWAGALADGLAVPLCGDDADALDVAGELVADVGSVPLPVGGLERAGYLEATAAIVIGMWFAGQDPRTMLPLAENAHG
ncbi:NADPH-dependent F420 reductase [Embleya sp. NBC_00896]|uniref:NADPH-dependent F420 reductase n=1 Tax=Embleya sp. NBC_00896 TaxID=2975961 RepID=UPI00386739F3|nr:NAD(P)-binding domain-containing protein [Embleya sp. NBC_00896]